MPDFSPWRTSYEVPSGASWELTVLVTDPEGCDVTVNTGSRRQRGLVVTTQGDKVHLRLATRRPGHYSVTLSALDECGASSSRIYHVIVKRGRTTRSFS